MAKMLPQLRIEKGSVILVILLFSLIAILLQTLYTDSETYGTLSLIVVLGVAVFNLIEIGAKKFTNISKLKKIRALEAISMIGAILLIIISLVSIPFIGYSSDFLINFSKIGTIVYSIINIVLAFI